jgi:hypothetical protein
MGEHRPFINIEKKTTETEYNSAHTRKQKTWRGCHTVNLNHHRTILKKRIDYVSKYENHIPSQVYEEIAKVLEKPFALVDLKTVRGKG